MVPEGWKTVRIGDIAQVKGGKRMPKGRPFAEGKTLYPYIRVSNFDNGTVNTESLKYVLPDDREKIKSYTISHKDLYISIAGTIGLVGTVPMELDGAQLTENAAKICFTSQTDFERDYIKYVLSSTIGKSQIDTAKGVGGGVPKLAIFRIENINVLLPPLLEQKKIAAILSSVDDAIQATQAVIDQTSTVKQGLMQQLLTRGIGHTRFKQTEIGEIPEEWDLVHLSEIASHERSSFTNGPFGSNLLKSDLRTEGVPVIYIRDIKTAIYNPVKQVYVDKDKANELSSCEVLPGDILITKVGDPPGIASIYPEGCEPAIVTQDVIRLRTNRKKCQPEFVRIVINSPLGGTLIDHISIEGTRKRMALGTFKKIPFPLPTLPEQEQITKAITLNENAIIEEQRKLNCFQDIKRGLMQDLLTGRVRVKPDEVNTT